jgi:hypothetical protein
MPDLKTVALVAVALFLYDRGFIPGTGPYEIAKIAKAKGG